jgi:hypothetical protein
MTEEKDLNVGMDQPEDASSQPPEPHRHDQHQAVINRLARIEGHVRR